MSMLIVGTDASGSLAGGEVTLNEPCLCAQMAPAWTISRPLTQRERRQIKRHAHKQCPICRGTGFEDLQTPNLFLNFANDNAQRLFQLLRLDPLSGSCLISEMRRAIMYARARFDSLAPALTAPAHTVRAPFHRIDGVVELHRDLLVYPDVTEEGLRQRLDTLAYFVEDVAEAGATHIRWS